MEKLHNRASGLGQFCYHLGKAFQTLKQPSIDITLYIPKGIKEIFNSDFKTIEVKKYHQLLGIGKHNFDVWHCTHQQSKYLPLNSSTKLIVTIHDLNFLIKYKGFKRTQKLRSLQKKTDQATVIVAISHYTASQIKQHLNIGDKEITVIYNGVSMATKSLIKLPAAIKNIEFIFTIGIISEKKNFHVLLCLLEKNAHLHLVIAGDNTSSYAAYIKQLAVSKGIENRLHLLGKINEETKYTLYNQCKAFVFPSLAEGFGLPVIEAMSLGKPVFLSNSTSLPEIGGNECYYWENFEPNHMNTIFINGLNNYRNDSEKPTRIIKWASQFSWDKAAEAYLQLYKNVAQ